MCREGGDVTILFPSHYEKLKMHPKLCDQQRQRRKHLTNKSIRLHSTKQKRLQKGLKLNMSQDKSSQTTQNWTEHLYKELKHVNINTRHTQGNKTRPNCNKFTVQSRCFDQLARSSVSPCHCADRRHWSETSAAPVLTAGSPADREMENGRIRACNKLEAYKGSI